MMVDFTRFVDAGCAVAGCQTPHDVEADAGCIGKTSGGAWRQQARAPRREIVKGSI